MMAGAVLALAAAGCGGSDDGKPGEDAARTAGTPAPQVSTPEGADPVRAEPVKTPAPPEMGALLRGNRFLPERVRVDRSGPITFVNQDGHEHRVDVGDGAVVPIPAKSSVSMPPPRPGTHRLVCRIHEEHGMAGELVVER